MHNTRCKFFDDNGNILSKRHLSISCPFVHPDDPAWQRARPSKPRQIEPFPETWAPHVPTLSSSNTTGLAATGRTWGKSAEDRFRRKSDAQPDTGHSSSKNATSGPSRTENTSSSSNSALAPKESSTSWADALAKAAEKEASNNPWGSSSGNDGWGSGGGSWGGANDTGTSVEKAKAADSGGWGTQASSANLDRPSTSGSLGDKGKGVAVGRQKDKEDIAMRDPSPPRSLPSTATAPIPRPIRDDRTKKSKRADLPLLNPAVRSARERTPSFSPAPSTTVIAAKPLPRPVMPSLSKVISPESAPNAPQGDEDGMGKMSRSGTPTSDTVTKSYKGYEGRAALFSEVVTHLQEAVVFEIVLLRAQAEAMRWKKTQSSEIYAHTTRKARTIMDDRRAQFQGKISGAKLARDRALQRLGSLPELPTRAEQLAGPKVEKETIRAYTEELKEWLDELERHRSLLKAKQDAEEANVNSSPLEPVSDIPIQPQLQTLQSLLQREKWTWTELKEAPSLIESAIEDAQAIIYREDYTRIDELCFDGLEVLDEQLPAADEDTPDIENQRFGPRIEANGKKIVELANGTTELFNKIASLKKEIEEVKKQREAMDEIYSQAEKQFSEFDSNKEIESTKIREMTEQLQSLSLHKKPAAKPSTTLSPVKIDDLLEYIRPIVVERVKADLTKIVQSLAMRCRENQDRMADEIDEMLKPVLASTEQIRQNSLSLSATSANQPATVSDTTVS